MNVEIKIDMRQFDAAMRDYLQHTSKTVSFAVNKAMRDAALRSVAYVQPADRNTLALWQSLAKSDPGGYISPFVAYLLRKQKEKAGTLFLPGVKYTRKSIKSMQAGRFYTRKEAKAFGKKVFASRYRAQTFLRAFFIAAAKRLTALGIGGGGSGGANAKQVPQLQIAVKPATEASPSGGFSVSYTYRRQNPHGEKASAILARALQQGLNEKAADMREYIARKLAEKAKQISTK